MFGLLLAAALVPLLNVMPTTAAGPDTDKCVGGVDAGDYLAEPTPLEVLAGCKGKLYHAGENSSHASDWKDVYSIRVEGSSTAKLDWQICNLSGDDYFHYEIWFYSDLFYPKHLVSDYVSPGQCSSAEPQMVEGFYKPGEWRFSVMTSEYLLGENQSLEYDMYAQPLWR